MANLTAKQQYWFEQLNLADSFDGSITQYAEAKKLPVKKLYRWRSYFKKTSIATDKAKPAFAQVLNSSLPNTCLKAVFVNKDAAYIDHAALDSCSFSA